VLQGGEGDPNAVCSIDCWTGGAPMIGSASSIRSRCCAGVAAMTFSLQTALAATTPAHARPEASTIGGLAQDWEAFTDMIVAGWSVVTSPAAKLSTFTPLAAPVIVSERQACPIAAKGGVTDCTAAAQFLCAQKGFTSGQGLDFESGRVCRGTGLESWSGSDAGRCKSKRWVTRAICW
jgi:hypothetical protein